jgi:curved DNA-binding protein
MTDHYATLGVPRTATASDIKQAFRRLASQHHPDKGGDTAKFQAIQAAYATLGDDQKRAEYNNPRPQFGPGPGPGFNFEEFFGAFGAGQRGHRPATHARISLWVTLEDVARGGPKIISLQMGRAASNVEINIPTGIEEGDTIRYAGLSPDGQDLIISYRIKPHSVWQRNRKDITAEQQIPLWDLILGGEVIIRDLLNNEMVITVPAKTQPGSLLRLRGRGLPPSSIPGKQTHGVGDLFVRVQALMPSQFSPALITAIEQERNQ